MFRSKHDIKTIEELNKKLSLLEDNHETVINQLITMKDIYDKTYLNTLIVVKASLAELEPAIRRSNDIRDFYTFLGEVYFIRNFVAGYSRIMSEIDPAFVTEEPYIGELLYINKTLELYITVINTKAEHLSGYSESNSKKEDFPKDSKST